MNIYSYSSSGYDGDLVQIEVNIFNRSLPGIDIVGLPGGAVRESKVRFRSAIINSGYEFPKGRVIINMAPAGERKEGACFDLPFACKVISFNLKQHENTDFLVLGELTLDGKVRKVKGILAAVSKAFDHGICNFIIPKENCDEALLLEKGNVFPVESLVDAYNVILGNISPFVTSNLINIEDNTINDFSDVMGQEGVKRALQIAVSGGHNILLFGPPGVGKSLSVSCLDSIIPDLLKEESLETTRIWSLAGRLENESVFIRKPPIRKPHHGASLEGLVGGGKHHQPGEISLAHNGYLFLDEIAEFKTSIIQSLRQPMEERRVSLNRATVSTWYPANFRLIATANPCPCANLGKEDGICMCSEKEIRRYWKRMGGAIMDRIDIRVPVTPVSTKVMLGEKGANSKDIKMKVDIAVNKQRARYKDSLITCNARIPSGEIDKFCFLSEELKQMFIKGVNSLSLSSRGCHSVLKISRTIADLERSENITEKHIMEAFTYRRYGDEDYYFN
ncbi:MAG: YifB family Mg chelatase-like AAA ATPase [Spirochaetaceae bacterium]